MELHIYKIQPKTSFLKIWNLKMIIQRNKFEQPRFFLDQELSLSLLYYQSELLKKKKKFTPKYQTTTHVQKLYSD